MANTTTATSKERPYKKSWIDRFNNWVETLPVGEWIFHILFGIVLIGVQLLILGLEGGRGAEELLPVIIFNGLATPYLLALIHLLDNQAVTSLDSMKSVLDTSEQEFEDYEYRLSHMPFLAPLIAGLVMTALTILTPLISIEPTRYAALEHLSVFTVVFHIIDKSSAFLIGVLIYHTVRQLRLVNSINSNHIRINLFHLRPVRAFSRLTASTAVGLLVLVYVWMLINPELLSDPVIFGYLVLFTLLAILVFVWPLYGVHRLMENEKEMMLNDIELRLETVFAKFNQGFQEDDYSEIGPLNGTIASLEIQHKRVSDIPTWPWKTEAARLALTAIALPLVLMVLQYFVLQALDR